MVGSPVFTIPKLGYVANYIQKPPGMYVAISAGAILLLLVFLPDLFGDDSREPKKKAKAPARSGEDPEPQPKPRKQSGKYQGKYSR